MAKVTLPPVTSGYNLQRINDNFKRIEDNINNHSIQRDNKNNTINQDLDMDSNQILNAKTDMDNPNSLVNVSDLTKFLSSLGFGEYEFVGDYGKGVALTNYNQIVRDKDGEFWRASGKTTLPYTLTGKGVDEDGALVSVGDAALRQDLSNPDKGAAMVSRSVVAVDSIAALMSLPEGQRKEGLQFSVASFYAGKNQGGGVFAWDAYISKSEANGGTIIDPDNIGELNDVPSQVGLDSFIEVQGKGEGSGCFVRVGSESLTGECWGIADDLEVSGALNKMFLATRGINQKISTHSNNIRIASEVSCYGTGVEFTGTVRFITSYAGSFTIKDTHGSRPSYQIDLSKVTNIPEMTYKIDFLSEVPVGHYVLINTTEKINRLNAGHWQHYDKTLPVKVVGEGGLVSCRFPWSVNRENITSVTVFEPVPNISISFSNIVVENEEDLPADPGYYLIAVRRDSITLEVKTISATHPSNRIRGTVTTSGNNVTIQNSKVLSLGVGGDRYAISMSQCVDLRILGCTDIGNGSAVAGRHGSNTRIIGCDFIGRVDDHMGSDMEVSQTKCDFVAFAGADILLKDVEAKSYQLLAVRNDTPILRGNVIIEGGAVLDMYDLPAITSILSLEVRATMSGFGYPPSLGDRVKISGVRFPERELFSVASASCINLLGRGIPSFVSEGGYVLKPRVVDISNIHVRGALDLVVGFSDANLFSNDTRPPVALNVSQCTMRYLEVNGTASSVGTPDREAWVNSPQANGTVVVRASGCEIDTISVDHGAIKSCGMSDSFVKTGVGSRYSSAVTGKQGRGMVAFSACTFGEGVTVNTRVDGVEFLNCRIKDYTNFKPLESKIIRSVGTVVDISSPVVPTIDLLQHVDGSIYQVG